MRINLSPQLTSKLLGILVGPLSSTYRIRVWNMETEDLLKRGKEGIIYTFWHNRLFPLVAYYRRSYLSRFPRGRVDVLVSESRDGEMAALMLHRFGFGTIRGSSSRRGREALLEMVERVKKRGDVGVIPDGPKGPRYVAKGGAVALAKATGVPILPVGVSAKPVKIFNSWDRFMLPLPFAQVGILFGEPLYVAKEEETEASRIRFEEALMSITRETDARMKVEVEY